MGGPWPMEDDTYGGQQTAQINWAHAHEFWDSVIGYGFRENNLRAMVIDTLQVPCVSKPLPAALCTPQLVSMKRLAVEVGVSENKRTSSGVASMC